MKNPGDSAQMTDPAGRAKYAAGYRWDRRLPSYASAPDFMTTV
jgi:hypothetical protein